MLRSYKTAQIKNLKSSQKSNFGCLDALGGKKSSKSSRVDLTVSTSSSFQNVEQFNPN